MLSNDTGHLEAWTTHAQTLERRPSMSRGVPRFAARRIVLAVWTSYAPREGSYRRKGG